MSNQKEEKYEIVSGFTKFGLFLISFVIGVFGIGLISINEYLFGGISLGQFILWCILSRRIFDKLDSKYLKGGKQ